MKSNSEQLAIYREEFGYFGIKGVGVTTSGKVQIYYDAPTSDLVENARVIQHSPVPGALSAPIKMFFDPSLACPLKCPFCLAGVSVAKETGEKLPAIPPEQVKRINSQIIDAGVLQVKLGGGEPFINSSFWSSVEQLGSAGIALSTSTSGVTLEDERLLTNDQITSLKKNRVKISISIDGEPDYHDAIRGKADLLESALRGRSRLLENGIPADKIEFRATISKDDVSYSQVDFFDRLSRELGTKFRIRLAKPSGSAIANGSSVLYPDLTYWRFFRKIRQLAKENPLLNLDEFMSFDQPSEFKTGMDCGAATRSAFVDARGNFMPCGFIDDHFPMPSHNLLEPNASNILNLWQSGEAFTQVRSFISQETATSSCVNCAYVDSCQGGCPSVRLLIGDKIDPLCPVEGKVYVKDARIATGSIFCHVDQEGKRHLVLTGEINDGKVVLSTPGGGMNGVTDNNVRETSLREIREEVGIGKEDLKAVDGETQLINFSGDEKEIFADDMPHAIILNNSEADRKLTLIAVYKYETNVTPMPTDQNKILVMVPIDKVSAIKSVGRLSDLASFAKVEFYQDQSFDAEFIPVGTLQSLLENRLTI